MVPIEFLRLLISAVGVAMRSHNDLIVENLLLRHQLIVLTRSGHPTKLRISDKLLIGVAISCSSARRR